MSTQTRELKPTVIEHAQPTLIEEIAEETKLRGALGLFDLDRAAEQAEQRVKALTVLRRAAIGSTKPIHWQLFKNEQGQIFARFNHAGAERIAFVLGITVTPKGQPKITNDHGKPTAEVYGSATSAVLGVTIDNIRSYRVQGEDFLGRPAADEVRKSKFPNGKDKVVVGVGDNDWLQSTMTGLISKGVRMLSGLVTCSVDELAEVWGMKSEEVEKSCTMGHGFSKEERQSAGQSAGGGSSRLATEPQRKLLFAKANGRAKELPEAGVDGGAILHEVIIEVCGPDATIETVTMDQVNVIIPKIAAWGTAA